MTREGNNVEPLKTDPTLDETSLVSTEKARELIESSEKLRTRNEKVNRKRFARLFKDPKAIEVTITLTDEVMRIHSMREAITIFSNAARKASIKGFGPFNGLGLKLSRFVAVGAPSVVIRLVHQRVRALSKDLILPAEQDRLSKHIGARKEEGIRLNINVLGEAVLGRAEAEERFKRLIEMIHRPEVDYISVKLSAVVAQIITIDHQGSLEKVCEKLRIIYRDADAHGTFINLDMEEFRDLALTVDAFKRVLAESEFLHIHAGIVLQAYLPESHEAFADLVTFAVERNKAKSGTIKIRLVKGANLAMERAEGELHGYIPAPYGSKSDVDASYSRLIDVALRPEHAHAVRIGIASHNLFHLTWALEVARTRNVLHQLDIEMLEGMANAEALAITRLGHQVLFYTPVTNKDDFASAVAYLVRRLDENTSDENYLKAAFEIGSNPTKFTEQKERFQKSVEQRHTISTLSRRHKPDPMNYETFHNQASGDPTNPNYLKSISNEITRVRLHDMVIPLVIDGNEITTEECVDGTDPGDNSHVWYSYCVADKKLINQAIAVSRAGLSPWSSKSVAERREILFNVANVMQSQRARTIAVMSRDAGKTISESDPEVSEAIDFARYYAEQGVDNSDSTAMGVVLVVPPWNFSYAIPAGGVCAALAAGNTVILKPAPETVATAWLLAQQLWEGGVPTDALQFVPTRDDDCGKHLVMHEGIEALILTGAFETAKMFVGWKPELNLLAETSGKNSLVISACADIDAAVKDLVQSAFGHAGQKCSAASLGIIVESIYNDPSFIRQLVGDVTTLKVGAGWDLSTSVGPIIHQPEGALLRALTTLDEGESWLVEPQQLDDAAQLWSPGVKVGIKPGSWSHQNEWFGPVLGLMVAPDLKSAIELQNATEFGLTAGIHSLDADECSLWMDSVEAGNLYINRGITGAVVQRQPFGGWKRSSVGANAKAGGPNYINALRNWKPLQEPRAAKWSVDEWWKKVGGLAIDATGLTVEKNYQRYRKPLTPILVRIDDSTSNEDLTLIKYIAQVTGTDIHWSTATAESFEEFIERATYKVRWLSSEKAPREELIAKGVSLDPRPVAQRGDIEAPRWLLEQSVAITHHRYGNVNGGPKPICSGLAHL
jgi:RHH-type proline utilization regulon transcriptional repressor/proline dehydrogenase/delta 1-pyrroline-5-carboxylate dehydrogenase